MSRAVFLITVFLLTSWVARADQYRHRDLFSSANGRFEARLKDRDWRLIERSSGKELYRFSDYRDRAIWFHTMTLVVSDDGQSVVAIDDYSAQDFRQNPEVLFFFQEGRIIRAHKLLEISNPRFIIFSASHFRWLYSAESIVVSDSRVALTSYDLVNLTFHAETGELLSREKDPVLTEGTVFVSGPVTVAKNDRYKLHVDCVVHGKARKGSTMTFESTKIKWIGGSSSEALVIRDGKLVASKGIIFNACHGLPK